MIGHNHRNAMPPWYWDLLRAYEVCLHEIRLVYLLRLRYLRTHLLIYRKFCTFLQYLLRMAVFVADDCIPTILFLILVGIFVSIHQFVVLGMHCADIGAKTDYDSLSSSCRRHGTEAAEHIVTCYCTYCDVIAYNVRLTKLVV